MNDSIFDEGLSRSQFRRLLEQELSAADLDEILDSFPKGKVVAWGTNLGCPSLDNPALRVESLGVKQNPGK